MPLILISPSVNEPSAPEVPVYTAESHTLLLAHGEDFTDSSIYGRTLTAVDSAQIGTIKKFGSGAFKFDGDGDSVRYPQGTIPLDADFTIEAWVYMESGGNGTYQAVFSSDPGTLDQRGFQVEYRPGDGAFRALVSNGTSWATYSNGSVSLPLNTWTHVAFVRHGSTFTLYINGTTDVTLTNGSALSDLPNPCFGGRAVAGQWWKGYIDEVRIVDYAAYTGDFSVAEGPFYIGSLEYSLDEYTVLMLHGEDMSDSSQYNHVATTKTVSNTVGKFNDGIDFTGGTLVYPNHSSWQTLGTQDWTFDFWVNFSNPGAYWNEIFSIYPGSIAYLQFVLGYPTANDWTLRWGTTNIMVVNHQVEADVWMHVALVRSGNDFILFLDGTEVGRNTYAADIVNLTGPLYVGSQNGTNARLQGVMDEIRWSVGVARWTTDFSVPTGPYAEIPEGDTVLLMQGENANTDSSSYSRTITGATLDSSGKFGRSVDFPGTSAYVYDMVPDFIDAVEAGDGSWAVDFWLYMNTKPSNSFHSILSLYATSSPEDNFFQAYYDNRTIVPANQRGMRFNMKHSGANTNAEDNSINSESSIPLQTWVHVAISSDGEELRGFIDGTQYISGDITGSMPSLPQDVKLRINGREPYDDAVGNFEIDELRFRTSTSGWTSDFVPPASAIMPVDTTRLLLHGEDFTDSSANAHTVTNSGTVSTTNSGKFGKAFSFPGNGHVSFSPSVLNYANDFSIDFWVYSTSFTGVGTIDALFCGNGSATDVDHGLLIGSDSTGKIGFWLKMDGVGSTWSYAGNMSTTATTLNTWHHVAFTKNGSTYTLFLDGVKEVELSAAGTLVGPALPALGGRSVDSQFMFGYMDEIRISDGVQWIDNFNVPSVPYGDYGDETISPRDETLLLLHGEDLSDSSAYERSIINTGVTVNADGRFDQALSLADGDYLSLDMTEDFYWNAQDFTIEAWVYTTQRTSQAGGQVQLIGNMEPNADTNYWSFGLNGTGDLVFYYYTGSAKYVTSNVAVPLNEWTHVAFTLDSTTSTIRLFIDGSKVAEAVISGTPQHGLGTPLTIGRNQSNNFIGKVDELRVIKGRAMFSGVFVPPVKPYELEPEAVVIQTSGENTVLLLHGEDLTDSSNYSRELVNTGASITSSAKYGEGAIDLSGSTYASIAMGQDFYWDQQDYTIEGWVYLNSYTDSGGRPPMIGHVSATASVAYWSFGPATNGTLTFQYFTGVHQHVTGGTVPLNQWTHVAMTYSGTTIRLFIDGVKVAEVGKVGTPQYNDGYPLVVGRQINVGTNGKVDEIRLLKGEAAWTEDFTPPAGTYVVDSGLEVLYMDGETLTDRSARSHTITSTGVIVDSGESKFGGGSLYFNGSSWLQVTDSEDFSFADKNWTIDLWMRPNFGYWTSFMWFEGPETLQMASSPNGYGLCFQIGPTNDYNQSNINLDVSWHHVALVRNGDTVTQYIDGVSTGNTYDIGTDAMNNPTNLWIGKAGSGWITNYTGHMDELRIVKGEAVWTQDFTPPTQSYGGGGIDDDVILMLHGDDFTDSGPDTRSVSNTNMTIGSGQFDGSLEGDGTGYLELDVNAVWNLTDSNADGEFTIDAWIRIDAYAGANGMGIVGTHKSGTGSSGWTFYYSSSKLAFFTTSNTEVSASVTWTIGQWYHVAVSKKGGVIYLFRDGTLLTSAANDGSLTSSNPLRVGRMNGTDDSAIRGGIDELRVSKGIARWTTDFAVPAGPYTSIVDYNTKLLLHGEDLTDSSPSSRSISTVGTPESVAGGKFDNCIALGSGNRLYAANESSLHLTNQDFAMDFWVKFNGTGNQNFLCHGWDNLGGYAFDYYSSGLYFAYKTNTTVEFHHPWSYTQGQWYHVALTRQGATLRFFIDGTQVATHAISGGATASIAVPNLQFFVGYDDRNGWGLNGHMDEVRLSIGTSRWTTDFIPPVRPYPESTDAGTTVLLLHSEDLTDSSSRGHTISGPTINTTDYKFGGGSLNAAVSNVLTSDDFDFGTGDFTLDLWIRQPGNHHGYICSSNNVGDPSAFLLASNTDGTVGFYMKDTTNPSMPQALDAGSQLVISSSTNLLDGAWQHVAVIRYGDVLVLFVNGTIEATYDLPADYNWPCDTFRVFGQYPANMIAGIDELRVINGNAAWTADFTPPTEPY